MAVQSRNTLKKSQIRCSLHNWVLLLISSVYSPSCEGGPVIFIGCGPPILWEDTARCTASKFLHNYIWTVSLLYNPETHEKDLTNEHNTPKTGPMQIIVWKAAEYTHIYQHSQFSSTIHLAVFLLRRWWRSSPLILAASMKSFSVSPPAWVKIASIPRRTNCISWIYFKQPLLYVQPQHASQSN